MSRSLLCVVLLLHGGCFLFPSKETACSDRRPCPSGQVCNRMTALCVDGPADMSTPQDLSGEPDLLEPDLSMPDLVPPADLAPECTSDPGCPAGLACNTAMGKCVACQSNADCQSLICDPYQTVTIGATTTRGFCVRKAEVVYVDSDPAKCTSGDGSDPNKALCDLQNGIAALDNTKKWIRVAASSTPYGRITFANKSGTLYGPAGVGGKVQIGNDLMDDSVKITGSSDVVLFGVEVLKGQNGVSCTGAMAKLKLRRSAVLQSAGIGVTVNQCALEIDRTLVQSNEGGGLLAANTPGFTITNNLFLLNGKDNGNVPAVRFDGTVVVANSLFRFNTVADNKAMNGVRGGVSCPSMSNLPIKDSIVVGNKIAGMTQFSGDCVLTQTAVGAGDQTPGGLNNATPEFEPDYRLKDVAASTSCCVNKASREASTALPFDHFGNTRPDCSLDNTPCDVGAHELK